MVAFLQNRYGAAGLNGIGKGALELLQDHYLRPAARAALFEALVQLPGLHAQNVAQSHLIGVSCSVTGPDNQPVGMKEATTLLFDGGTHAFVGVDTDGMHGEQAGSRIATVGIVDRVGQRP